MKSKNNKSESPYTCKGFEINDTLFIDEVIYYRKYELENSNTENNGV